MGVINLGWLIKKLKNKGFVTRTDYATATGTPGVIKTSSSYGTSMTSTGALIGVPKTVDTYNSGGSQMFICKGTIENIKGEIVKSVLASLADSDGSAASGTKWDTLVLEKTADGYTLSFKNTTTP